MPIDSGNLALKGLDDLFSTEENRQEEQREQVQQIPIDELHPFTNHPFKVLDDEAMTRTVESIAQYGVLAPLIARPRPEVQIQRRAKFHQSHLPVVRKRLHHLKNTLCRLYRIFSFSFFCHSISHAVSQSVSSFNLSFRIAELPCYHTMTAVRKSTLESLLSQRFVLWKIHDFVS